MSEVPLSQLRMLRTRTAELLEHVITDLRQFLHTVDHETFVRTPESKSLPDDVNVTTTCSCLMALALTHRFQGLYKLDEEPAAKVKEKARNIFERIIRAPWMSSGLTGNNAFTTTLVLRTFGFLVGEGLIIEKPSAPTLLKDWEIDLGIKKTGDLAKKLRDHTDPASEFLWCSLSDKARISLGEWSPAATADEDSEATRKLRAALALELRRIIQNGWIYLETVFPNVSEDTKRELNEWKHKPTAYKLARLNQHILAKQYSDEIESPSRLSLPEVAARMALDASNFSINEYPPAAAVVYWFVDGVARAKIELKATDWTTLCKWAVNDFLRQRSLTVAEHDVMMDPVAMAMAACLCARLRTLSGVEDLGTTKDHLAMLPSVVELEHSIQELFKRQTNGGIWPKYFPLFHYQDAGSNFCFTFELLEAVLCEFGRPENKLLDSPLFIKGLQRALVWCEKNHLRWSHNGTTYTGWSSGGYLETLRKGQPESWPTAVVHMFLWELHEVLGARIQKALIKKYKSKEVEKSDKPWEDLTDVELPLRNESPTTLKKLLEREILNHAKGFDPRVSEKMKGRISVLLFGPPGTSKTKLSRAVAAKLGWPLIELDPSHFLSKGIENIYGRAEEIFGDLKDLSKVVVLLDEMDALVQTREEVDQPLDVTSRFLTTSMLPKLARLHDDGKLIFFFATNYPEKFDQAIKRPGRFDLLVCVSPPTWQGKLGRLEKLLPRVNEASERAAIKSKLDEFTANASAKHIEMLDLLTFKETQTFLENFADAPDQVAQALHVLPENKFFDKLHEFSTYMTLRKKEPKKAKFKTEYQRFKSQRSQSQRQ